ncbi:MAG TPA: ACT domain-containing protein [Allosphingosinicella sp.]|jgi:acetolactate synthase regulatory subunit
MIGRLAIQMSNIEGALSRVLGLVERRGFRLQAVAMSPCDEGSALTVDVEMKDAGRSFDVLALQLGRLREVRTVSFSTAAGEAMS